MSSRSEDAGERHEAELAKYNHPGFSHSGNIGDGSYVTCIGCGGMFDCYEPDEATPHIAACPRTKQ